MTYQEAAQMLEKLYAEGMASEDVYNPLAWALYKVWKKADEEGTTLMRWAPDTGEELFIDRWQDADEEMPTDWSEDLPG